MARGERPWFRRPFRGKYSGHVSLGLWGPCFCEVLRSHCEKGDRW